MKDANFQKSNVKGANFSGAAWGDAFVSDDTNMEDAINAIGFGEDTITISPSIIEHL